MREDSPEDAQPLFALTTARSVTSRGSSWTETMKRTRPKYHISESLSIRHCFCIPKAKSTCAGFKLLTPWWKPEVRINGLLLLYIKFNRSNKTFNYCKRKIHCYEYIQIASPTTENGFILASVFRPCGNTRLAGPTTTIEEYRTPTITMFTKLSKVCKTVLPLLRQYGNQIAF